ncbi:uncharacterized protein EDB91DRAFT_1243698 [Suillus paluster]|uniref:uncharacterized protein n=1 Tax=Suillus paluster TaxID=48578 RepID=UPI001B85D783|nr:uncharacterized protein EDB91DRAFT_1243698 [Suillus paluster]KAG1751433.1 hypothetical protein EDB91DRAFT_1243698 [Suillus paluster]
MTSYGMPYLLEDKTGKLTGSQFVDINDRLRLTLRCTARESTHATYIIYSASGSDSGKPLVALDFGPNNSLGAIAFGSGPQIPMNSFLESSPIGSAKSRKFTGSDGQQYRWSWRTTQNEEWTCTNASNHHVASYSLKVPGEPEYDHSSGCVLTIEEAYPHLAAEMLASLMIMRHIVAHNL